MSNYNANAPGNTPNQMPIQQQGVNLSNDVTIINAPNIQQQKPIIATSQQQPTQSSQQLQAQQIASNKRKFSESSYPQSSNPGMLQQQQSFTQNAPPNRMIPQQSKIFYPQFNPS